MIDSYNTVISPGAAQIIEKRSRFIAKAVAVADADEAAGIIADVRSEHFAAKHHVFAYILRGTPVVERYSDDAEPQGTAGMPILEVLRGAGLENSMIVVTRYFGGVLLGTGGLLRAYTKSAKDALDAAGIAAVRRWVKLEAACPYSLLERMKTECLALEGAVSDVEYGADVRMTFLLPEAKSGEFQARVTELSAGQSSAQAVGEELMPVRVK